MQNKDKEPEKRLAGGKYGLNTSYYEKLLELYPLNTIHPGRRFRLKDLAERLRLQEDGNRFTSVISGWRRILLREGIVFRTEKDELVVLNESEKLKLGIRKS